MPAPNNQMMQDEESTPMMAQAKPTVDEENMNNMLNLLGAGKGAGGLEITTGMPFLEDDNFCRYRCLCYDSGCLKFDPRCQYYCLSFSANDGFKLITGMPIVEDENFCRSMCLCCDQGCRKFELKFQCYCLKFEV